MICLNCHDEFPLTIVVDGKEKNLQRRKYCPKCSPFGSHNTRPIGSVPIQKFCGSCGKLLKTKRRNKCNSCNVSNYRRNIKKKLVAYKEGKCKICGYNRCDWSMDFHHRDSSKKEFNVSHKGRTISFKKLLTEVDKCILVCKNCHGEIHAGLISIPL
jgi:hypothetical protein